MAKRKIIKISLIVALIMGPITVEIIAWVEDKLPSSETKEIIIDMMSFPGLFVTGLFYPEGTESMSVVPVYLILIFNWVFYMVFWYLVIRLAIRNIYPNRGGQQSR